LLIGKIAGETPALRKSALRIDQRA